MPAPRRFPGRFGYLLLGVWVLLGGFRSPPPTAAGPGEKVVRVGYQKYGSVLLVKIGGGLERRLAALGYRVEWKEFGSGPPLLEALFADSIDLGHAGNAPPVFAQAKGVAFVYLAHTAPNPAGVALLVPAASPARKVADLRGRAVAVAKGSNAHYFLTRALAAGGLGLGDVKIVFLAPPDARAAFASGRVDAWAVWDPFLADAELNQPTRVLVDGTDLTTNREFFFGRRGFVRENPAVADAFVAELREVGARADQDRKGTAAQIAPQLGIAPAIIERAEFRHEHAVDAPVSPAVLAEQQVIADAFVQLKLIPTPVTVTDAVR